MQIKKTALLLASSAYLASAQLAQVFAQAPKQAIPISPTSPKQGLGTPASPEEVQLIINNVVSLVYTVAILLVIVFLIWGAFEWITSGGDKEKIKGARAKIVNALIGLAILALVFVIAYIAATLLNIDFRNLIIKPLNSNT